MHILHLDENHPLLLRSLKEAGFENTTDYTSSKQEICAKLPQYEGIVIRSRFPIDAEFLSHGTQLKFIARVGAGLENIDLNYAKKLGIQLFSAPLGNSNAVGEHALGMLLGLTHKLHQAHKSIQKGKWQREAHRGVELEGKTVGIIGYGTMGKSFAKKLLGFDVKEVIFHDILPLKKDNYAKPVALETLQETADIVSLHTPQTPLTQKMINTTFFEGMKKPFWLINTARGSAIVTADLVAALKTGKVLGAGLDVLEYEKSSFENLFEKSEVNPQLDYLLNSPNVLLSPHVAGWTKESHQKLAQIIVEQICDHFKN